MVEQPTRNTAHTMQITAFDRMIKLDKDLSSWVGSLTGWPYSLMKFATMVCDACGVELVNEELPNGDYAIQQFRIQGVSGRKLLQWVGQIAGRFCRATPDGKIEFAWYTPSGVTIAPDGERHYYENTLRLEDYETYPIEKVQVHLTEDDVGAVWPDGPVLRKGGSVITVDDAANAPLQGLTLYGKTTQNGTPTPEAPVELVSAGDSGAINTTVCGANLFDRENAETRTAYIDPNGDLVGSPNYTTYYIPVVENTQYTLSTDSAQGYYFRAIRFCDSAKNKIGYDSRYHNEYGTVFSGGHDIDYFAKATFTTPKDCAYIAVGMMNSHFAGKYIMLNYGDVALPYEPYKEAQTITASTPNGLLGIPLGATIPDFIKADDVIMAGVWWDEKTQRYYISDTIDFARGVYVQRIIRMVLNGNEPWRKPNTMFFDLPIHDAIQHVNPPAMANVGVSAHTVHNASGTGYGFVWAYGPRICFENMTPVNNSLEELKAYLAENPIDTMYVPKTPIETPLTEEELTAYAALHTNKPNTTVYNDSGAYMEATYMTGEKNTYRITGNYLLTADATDDLQPIAQSLYEQLKDITYTPCSVTIPACLDVQAGNTVQITDKNGKTVTAYVMRKTYSNQRDSLECTGSYRLDSTTVFNKQTYEALSGKMMEVALKMEGLMVKASDLETEFGVEVDNLNRKITEESTSVLSDCNQILMSALQNYVQTANYDEFRQTVEAQVKLLRDEFLIKFEETDTRITEVDGELQEKFNQIATIFEFTINGFKIGKVGSPYKIFMDDNEFAMSVNDTRVLWFELSENSQQANIPELNVTRKLNLFGYLIDMDSYGNVNCEYVGE